MRALVPRVCTPAGANTDNDAEVCRVTIGSSGGNWSVVLGEDGSFEPTGTVVSAWMPAQPLSDGARVGSPAFTIIAKRLN